MKISKEVLVREITQLIAKSYIKILLASFTIAICLRYFIYQNNVPIPGFLEIVDISLILTFLKFRVKIDKLDWKPVLSEILQILITTGMIYLIWNLKLQQLYSLFCVDVRIEHILIMKIIYILYSYIDDKDQNK